MAQFTEEEKMLRRIDKRFSKGVVEYGLIEDGDKILIGLSGGKDSLALVELLARRVRVYKPRFSLSTTKLSMKQTSSTPFSMRKLDLLFSNNCSASSVERFLFLRSEM